MHRPYSKYTVLTHKRFRPCSTPNYHIHFSMFIEHISYFEVTIDQKQKYWTTIIEFCSFFYYFFFHFKFKKIECFVWISMNRVHSLFALVSLFATGSINSWRTVKRLEMVLLWVCLNYKQCKLFQFQQFSTKFWLNWFLQLHTWK